MNRYYKNEKGVALLIVLVVIIMVTGMMAMVLNISGTERNMAANNQRTTESFFAAGGSTAVSNRVIKDTLELMDIPTGYPGTVVVDSLTAGGNPTLPDFVEELRNGGGVLANDSTDNVPDLVVTAMTGQNIAIDIDWEAGGVQLAGSELQEFGIAHHKKAGGTGCASGNIYTVDTVSLGSLNTRSNVGSAYFDCQ